MMMIMNIEQVDAAAERAIDVAAQALQARDMRRFHQWNAEVERLFEELRVTGEQKTGTRSEATDQLMPKPCSHLACGGSMTFATKVVAGKPSSGMMCKTCGRFDEFVGDLEITS